MIKVRVSKRRVIAKRFNVTFLSKVQQEEIIKNLEEIIRNNHLNG